MTNVPYGYKLDNDGKLIADEFQSQIVVLMNKLRGLELSEGEIKVGIHEQDIVSILNELEIPKVAPEGYLLDESKIIEFAKIRLQEKLEDRLEDMKGK